MELGYGNRLRRPAGVVGRTGTAGPGRPAGPRPGAATWAGGGCLALGRAAGRGEAKVINPRCARRVAHLGRFSEFLAVQVPTGMRLRAAPQGAQPCAPWAPACAAWPVDPAAARGQAAARCPFPGGHCRAPRPNAGRLVAGPDAGGVVVKISVIVPSRLQTCAGGAPGELYLRTALPPQRNRTYSANKTAPARCSTRACR
jgi:hypothetical protein